MYKFNLSLNFNEIRQRIELDIGKTKPNAWAGRIGVSKSLISNVHGKSKKQNPPIPYVIAVANVIGKSIDWYLYGKTPENQNIQKIADPRGEYNTVDTSNTGACPIKCDDTLRDICRDVKHVMEEDGEFADALKANIKAFRKSVDIERRLKNLEKSTSRGQGGGIPQALARSTAKRRKAG